MRRRERLRPARSSQGPPVQRGALSLALSTQRAKRYCAPTKLRLPGMALAKTGAYLDSGRTQAAPNESVRGSSSRHWVTVILGESRTSSTEPCARSDSSRSRRRGGWARPNLTLTASCACWRHLGVMERSTFAIPVHNDEEGSVSKWRWSNPAGSLPPNGTPCPSAHRHIPTHASKSESDLQETSTPPRSQQSMSLLATVPPRGIGKRESWTCWRP